MLGQVSGVAGMHQSAALRPCTPMAVACHVMSPQQLSASRLHESTCLCQNKLKRNFLCMGVARKGFPDRQL